MTESADRTSNMKEDAKPGLLVSILMLFIYFVYSFYLFIWLAFVFLFQERARGSSNAKAPSRTGSDAQQPNPFPLKPSESLLRFNDRVSFLTNPARSYRVFLFLFCFAFLVFDPQYLESNVGVGLHTSNWAHWITSNRRQPSKPEDSDQVWMTPLLFVLFVIFNPFHLSSSYFPLPLFPLLFDLLFFPFFL